ncbi:related to gibberellin cluster - GA14-synthase [Fusarium torulosum]|uniref:Related to gibberellin cluster - GA14-synthase n=1 Tax=Fusarium torulosum TaxID=33205 RepID=A0AAE8MMF5_9HYPO|nr:related to gibberellin cluster - GA14-synthase [Fusarium torulosum]
MFSISSYNFPIHIHLLPLYIQVLAVGGTLVVGYTIWCALVSERPLTGFPVATIAGENLGPRESYLKDASRTIASGIKAYSGPFQIITGTGPKIVLPNKYADELRNRPELDFNEAFREDFFAHYPGFDGFRASLDNPTLIPNTLRVKMTQSLGLVINHVVDETTDALKEIYGEDENWQSIAIKQKNLNLVARLSSRVFLGKPICRNERWLEIAREHTVHSFLAARDLRAQRFFMRPIMHYLMPHNQSIQRHYKDAKTIISTEVARRKVQAEVTLAAGGNPPKVSDAIGWMVEMAGGKPVDYVAAQLSLTVAAIHATTEALTVALLDLVTYPELITQLRKEIIDVLKDGRWSKQALYKMKLMDSFLKESQRLHPPSDVSMNRKVMQRITLSDGTVLQKGVRLMVASRFRDPETYPDPNTFVATRFLDPLNKGSPNSTKHYVTTSAEMFAFGHGKHACPGRFLASTELKVALCHMLLKYDWVLDNSDDMPMFFDNETAHMTNPGIKFMLRRRKEEINLDLAEDAFLMDVEE